jgi:hypothetical protein
MIEVNRESWHARVYLWWYFAAFPHRRRDYEQGWDKPSSNLCPYVRVVLLWAPLRWLFYQGRVGIVPVAWIAWPVLLLALPQPLGYLSYTLKRALWITDIVLALVAMFALTIYLSVLLSDWLDRRFGLHDRFRKMEQDRYLRKKDRIAQLMHTPPKKKVGPSFWKLIRQRMLAVHDRVCPEIAFKSPDQIKD